MANNSDGDFGDALRRSRRAAGLTQGELAERAGLSVRGIADLERGVRHTPRRETLTLLAEALGLTDESRSAFMAAARRDRSPSGAAAGERSDDAARTSHLSAGSDVAGILLGERPFGQAQHNLPAQTTPLLGRAEAVQRVVQLVRRADVRLVTLTGPGGVGKTRLALEVAAVLLGEFRDGVWYVRLSRVSDPAMVVAAIARTLGLQDTGVQPIADTLRDHLRERHSLLLLDNCEQVAAAATEVAWLLQDCPAVKVLVTSRVRLRLRGEHEYLVTPLGLPPMSTGTPAYLAQYSAVELFVERALAARADFMLTEANASAVANICTHLDGLPLAIELAASRIKVLPPAALLARIESGLGVLVGGAHDLDEHQRTMQATLAWSEGLLAPPERALLRRLAVFSGGCTLEAVEAVCLEPEGVEPLHLDVFDGMSSLVDQSLVQQREESGEARFGLLHIVREYASVQLEASGEAEMLRRAHLRWVVALAERAEPGLSGPQAHVWNDTLEREYDNVRAALRFVIDRGEGEMGLRLVGAIFRFLVVRGHLREGRAWAEQLLSRWPGDGDPGGLQAWNIGLASPRAVLARALRAAGVMALYQADESAAGVWLEQAVTEAREANDLETAALALTSLGVVAMHRGDLERARAQLEASLSLLRAVGELRGMASALINLGLVAYFQGDLDHAEATEVEARDLARTLGDLDYVATALANLASIALRRGEVRKSESLSREALALYRELGDLRRCAVGLEGLASAAGMAQDGERAARLLGAATALREQLDAPNPAHEQAEIDQAVAAARTSLGAERWAATFAAGRELSLELAVVEALSEPI